MWQGEPVQISFIFFDCISSFLTSQALLMSSGKLTLSNPCKLVESNTVIVPNALLEMEIRQMQQQTRQQIAQEQGEKQAEKCNVIKLIKTK